MSFVTTPRGAAVGSAAPPDPCAHGGAAASDAPVTTAHHRAQCVIPTSVEGRSLLASTQREPDIHVAAGGRLIVAPRHEVATHANRRRVDRHGPDVRAVENIIEAHEGAEPHASERT